MDRFVLHSDFKPMGEETAEAASVLLRNRGRISRFPRFLCRSCNNTCSSLLYFLIYNNYNALNGQHQRICIVCRFSFGHGLAAIPAEFRGRRQLVAAFFTMVHGVLLVQFWRMGGITHFDI